MAEIKKTDCGYVPEFCPHVKAAADAAVKQVFAILGVDIDVPKDVETFRENLRFGANMRAFAGKGVLAIAGSVALAATMALWTGISTMLSKGGH